MLYTVVLWDVGYMFTVSQEHVILSMLGGLDTLFHVRFQEDVGL